MSILRAVAPVGGKKQAAILDAIEPVYTSTLAAAGIDTPYRIAHFTAQIAHESDGFSTTEEYASGAAYEGRENLGNAEPGDGRRFKGRGLIQLTGRFNYVWASEKLGVDLVSHPERAAEPVLSLRIACLYWQDRDINRLADRDDVRGVTRRINGGFNGLADRQRYLTKAKAWLAENDKVTFTHRPMPESWWEKALSWFR